MWRRGGKGKWVGLVDKGKRALDFITDTQTK